MPAQSKPEIVNIPLCGVSPCIILCRCLIRSALEYFASIIVDISVKDSFSALSILNFSPKLDIKAGVDGAPEGIDDPAPNIKIVFVGFVRLIKVDNSRVITRAYTFNLPA